MMDKDYQIFGIRAVIEAITAGKTVDKVFVQKGLKGSLFQELQVLLQKEQIMISYVPVEKLNRLTKKNHQGVVANVSPVEYHDFENLVINTIESGVTPLFLILDHLSDVRNFGAIIRTAECTGVSGIIIPKRGSVSVTADTVKTSAGAVFKVPICKVDNLRDAIYYLQGSGIKTVVATEKTDQQIYDVTMTEPLAIIMGAEDVGVSPALLKLSDEKAKLPMLGDISSLNVSVACGVFLYEVVRQRLTK
ncbi:putative trmH family tRNA/rRNA methyltransferase yacO [Capnocytophaga canis]|uniref:Putative trmH family tRNA/rRNA methyltransferase yacO n=2 Tax=Capnocytophaga canis TaxID=1848903 RepID=A0A0B7IFD2_9FLAO|nr:putative trmH family tRNA/rRNA methyltransferase yacO [Capnocytophaga canis]CEN47430.1 putative trmH family tRNA/rRNA methyltransferase yacO [Capnocytophaga canis]CEN50510.1 putative trmH family tRNA/rRNA methyltransferase yacO [Capnocytophaga canis]